MRTVAVIQARMESTRFPGKVLANIRGKPMLERVIERVRASGVADELVLCIPDTGANDILRWYARRTGCSIAFQYPAATGTGNDLLEAYAMAAGKHGADVVIRITADCPLVCPDVIQEVAACWLPHLDYCSNVLERTWPRGLDVELMSRSALERLLVDTDYGPDHEHVTLSFRRDSELWRTTSVVHTEDHSDLNWSVDLPQDLERVSELYERVDDLAPYPALLVAWEKMHA